MKEEYLGLRKVEQKALHLVPMWEEMKVLMKAVTRDPKRVSMKVMNLDLSKAQEMVPVWEEMTDPMMALNLGWMKVQNSDPRLV